MSELSEESKALIEAEGPLDEATSAEIAAMHVRVVAAIGAGAVASPSPSPDPSPLAGKAAAATSLKVAGSALAAAVGSGALLFALSQPAPQRTPMPTPARSALAAAPAAVPAPAPPPSVTAPPLPSAPAEAPRAVAAPALRSSKQSVPAPSAPAPSASEEALLVAAAEAQLRGGHPAAALALYERHLREYPKGALRQESQTGRIVALCGVGRTAEARADVERFAAGHPGSPSLLRMQRACGMQP